VLQLQLVCWLSAVEFAGQLVQADAALPLYSPLLHVVQEPAAVLL
jgi:hypothetical protein